jgi:hypothetical protein
MWPCTTTLAQSARIQSARPSPLARRAHARRATANGSIARCGFQDESIQPTPRASMNTNSSTAATRGPVPGARRCAPRSRATRKATFHAKAATAMPFVVAPLSR